MTTLLEKIKSRGHWKVVIRPLAFKETRLSEIKTLLPLLEKNSVQLRGWDFPHIDHRNSPIIGLDWIGQECDFGDILEIWRFYQSGQFVHTSGIRYDWMDPKEIAGWRLDKKTGPVLGIGDTVSRFTEIFEFASRLALTDAGDEKMHIHITLVGLQGRALWVDSYNRAPMFQPYAASIDEFPQTIELSRTSLIAESKELALRSANELFQRFGWDPTLDLLRGQQSELYRR